MRTILAAAAALLAFGGTAAAQDGSVRDADFKVADIVVRLAYEQTGVLSRDITAAPPFVGWNTIIGEGGADETASDMLVTAVIEGPAGEHALSTPLDISVRNAKGRVIAKRRFPALFVVGRLYRSLFLPDSTCGGTLTVTARLGASVRTEKVTLDCGE